MAASRLLAVNQSSGGSDLLLLAIAGPVIAGTSLFGGRGTVWDGAARRAGDRLDLQRHGPARARSRRRQVHDHRRRAARGRRRSTPRSRTSASAPARRERPAENTRALAGRYACRPHRLPAVPSAAPWEPALCRVTPSCCSSRSWPRSRCPRPPPPPRRPSNDAFGDAAPLTSDGAALLGDNLGSTSQPAESPGHGDQTWDDCATFAQRPDCGGSVWYDFTPPTTESYTVETCDLGTEVDTVLTAFTGSGLPALTEVAHNDDACQGGYGSNGSRITFAATADTPYRIQVSGYSGQEGTFWLRAFPTAAAPPAAPIDTRITRYQAPAAPGEDGNGTHSGGRRTATFAFVSTNPAATFECSLDSGTFAACTSPAAYDGITADGVQHSFRVRASAGADTDATLAEQRFTLDASAPDTSVLTPATDGTTGGSPFPFALGSTERSPNFPSMCTLDGSDQFSCGGTSQSLTGLCDGPHLLSARSFDESRNFDPTPAQRAFSITGSGACAAPQLGATTTGLSPTRAQVMAPITTGGAPVTATLRYGTTAAYGELTRFPLAANNNTVNLSAQGLTPGTTYHYALGLASTVGAPVSSGDQTFTTPALGAGVVLPSVVVGAPQVTGQHAARIPVTTDVGAPVSSVSVTAYLDDQGPATLASPVAFRDESVPSTTVGSFAAPLDAVDLKPGTTYHYRVLVSGLESVLTEDRTFTTASPPSPPAEPAAPAAPAVPSKPAGTPKAKHFRISKGRVKVSAFKRSARSVKITVSGLPKGTKVALGVKGSRSLGKGRATAPRSGTVTIRVKLGKTARKALRSSRLKRLTFTVKATPPGDTSSSVTVKVTLRR